MNLSRQESTNHQERPQKIRPSQCFQKIQKNPEKIYNIYFDDLENIVLPSFLKKELVINAEQFIELNNIVKKLVNAFRSIDATTIEINPLVLNKEGKFILLDAKISLDDNALFRHPEFEKIKDLTEEDPLELEATQNDMNYVKLNGSIGCMVNGAGLAMATMDIIKHALGMFNIFVFYGQEGVEKRLILASCN